MGQGRAARWVRWESRVGGALCAAAVLCVVAPSVLALGSGTGVAERVRGGRRVAARPALTPWEQAERTREELESVPEAERTRAQYTRAIEAYRAIYHGDPGDLHAAAAVYSVAELLAEQGRTLHDPKLLKGAIGQYEFLRKQYPGSSLRVQALLDEGQIAQNELRDTAGARAAYGELVKSYPRSAQAEEARAALGALDGTGSREQGVGSREQGRLRAALDGGSGAVAAPVVVETAAAPVSLAQVDVETRPAAGEGGGPKKIGRRAVVSGIRHWSTATYTRVAIDLGDSVTYEAARVPDPDRIYFDLHGTRLAQELVGKSFSVTDDGFLKKIRAAQFSDDMTRVVLDVNDVTEYSAFLLPNPYRLIIDIHGRQEKQWSGISAAGSEKPGAEQQALGNGGRGLEKQGAERQAQTLPGQNAVVSTGEVPAPHAAGVVQSTVAKPVPNTLATKQASSAEVAAVSEVPGKVEATTRPTSQPISAVVGQGQSTGARAQGTGAVAESPAGPEQTSARGVSIAEAPATAVVPGPAAKKSRRGGKTLVEARVSSGAVPARAAVPMADGETSLVRALGLKIGRIVIDAGHGGHDSGTLGADGLQEKDVVLDVALRLGKLLHERLGAEIIYTRSDDTFIPLETRTAIANKAQADLFLSIHANSSVDASARGVETYYLNFTSDPSAIETAARENAVSDQSIHQLSDLVKKIALKDKIEESREFASDVEGSLYAGLAKGNAGLKDRGVKKAPFVVLIGANMPSILAEISFVTNPKDADQLRNPDYRERVAESLYRGVARYEGGLSGLRTPLERASVGQ